MEAPSEVHVNTPFRADPEKFLHRTRIASGVADGISFLLRGLQEQEADYLADCRNC